MSTRPTRSNVTASRVNHPTVSKLAACGSTPSSGIRPCVGRSPYRPQKLAGIRTEPPVSEPSAKSTTPPATAEAEPLDDPPGTRPGAAGIHRRSVVRVRSHDAACELVGMRLADEGPARVEQRLYCRSRSFGGAVRALPVGVASAGHVARHVEDVLRGEGHAGQRPVGSARNMDVQASEGIEVVGQQPVLTHTPTGT